VGDHQPVNQLTVRALRADDVRVVAQILGHEVRALGGAASQDQAQVGAELFGRLLREHMDALWAWLADLAGLTPDALSQEPLDAPLQIIEQVLEDPQIGPFVERVSGLLAKAPTGSGTSSPHATAGPTA